jgi:hypothetical protein
MSHIERLTDSRPTHRPRFLREIEERSEEVGFIHAIHETLEQDNVTVNVEGDLERLEDHEGGLLFVGDHKDQWEFVALMDMLARMNRDDMLNVAKFYVKRQVHQAFGRAASRLVLPVYPRILASDRGEFFNTEMINRIAYRRHLLTLAESARANEAAIATSSERLADDGVVNIFPVGSVVDARRHAWRTGVGRIIQQIPEESKGDVLVVPYGLESMSRAKFLGAVAMRGHGIFGRPQSMNVHVGPIQTANELTGSVPAGEREDPAAITKQLYEQFLEHFDDIK